MSNVSLISSSPRLKVKTRDTTSTSRTKRAKMRRKTHKLPSPNRSKSATFFFVPILSPFNSWIGRSIITISSTIEKPAPIYAKILISIQRVFGTKGFHNEAMGTHWKTMAKRKAMTWVVWTSIAMCTIVRKRGVVKMRRKRRRIENFGMFWVRR